MAWYRNSGTLYRDCTGTLYRNCTGTLEVGR
jgi:hypothetical protein